MFSFCSESLQTVSLVLDFKLWRMEAGRRVQEGFTEAATDLPRQGLCPDPKALSSPHPSGQFPGSWVSVRQEVRTSKAPQGLLKYPRM